MKNRRYVSRPFVLDWQKCFIFFLIIWLIVNLLQAIFTEVMSDEAYYFLYGQHLAWGYFDHPPMVGLMTYLSNLIFDGNLSVRFVTVILQVFTIFLVWKTIADKNPDTSKVILFFIITASLVMFQVYGFVTTPDAPLLFFTALFLWSYQRFLSLSSNKRSWQNTFLVAVSIAGMVYSKYQAVLVIGLVLLSNWRILLQYKAWLAGLFAALLLIPHFHWQFANNFPSFQYHLSDRSSAFKWGYFLEYLPNQLAVFNPFTLGAAVYVLIRYKPKDIFERGLYFLIIGFIAFFWITSFRGHVEPHWTVACSIPMIILLYRRSLENPKLMRYVKRVIAASLFLILVARILLPSGYLPERLGFTGKAAKSKRIEAVAGDLPVVFTGSFQNPSNYRFFTGKESFVLSAIDSRQTQFDIWQKELAYQGKPVFVLKQEQDDPGSSMPIDGKKHFSGFFAENFQSVNRLKITYELKEKEVLPGDRLVLPFILQNPTNSAIDFEHPEFPVTWYAAYSKNQHRATWKYAECQLDSPVRMLPAHATVHGNLTTVVPDLSAGEYQFTLTLVNSLCAARNSLFVLLKIK